MELLQWMLAGLLQCFIASMTLMQCSGRKRDKNRQSVKKTEPPKEEEALEPEKPSKVEAKDNPEPKNESERDKVSACCCLWPLTSAHFRKTRPRGEAQRKSR